MRWNKFKKSIGYCVLFERLNSFSKFSLMMMTWRVVTVVEQTIAVFCSKYILYYITYKQCFAAAFLCGAIVGKY